MGEGLVKGAPSVIRALSGFSLLQGTIGQAV